MSKSTPDYKARCEKLEIEKEELNGRLERCSASRLALKRQHDELVVGWMSIAKLLEKGGV